MNFIFGVCDRRQRLKTLYYLFQTFRAYWTVCYLFIVQLLCFLFLKWNRSKSENTVQICNIFNKLLCETELHQSSRGGIRCVEMKTHQPWVFVHNAETTMQHLSSVYHVVRVRKKKVQSSTLTESFSSILQKKKNNSPRQCCQTSPKGKIDCENVNCTQSQFQLDDFQALCRTLRLQFILQQALRDLNNL